MLTLLLTLALIDPKPETAEPIAPPMLSLEGTWEVNDGETVGACVVRKMPNGVYHFRSVNTGGQVWEGVGRQDAGAVLWIGWLCRGQLSLCRYRIVDEGGLKLVGDVGSDEVMTLLKRP